MKDWIKNKHIGYILTIDKTEDTTSLEVQSCQLRPFTHNKKKYHLISFYSISGGYGPL